MEEIWKTEEENSMIIKGGGHGFEQGKGKDERTFLNFGVHFSNFGEKWIK